VPSELEQSNFALTSFSLPWPRLPLFFFRYVALLAHNCSAQYTITNIAKFHPQFLTTPSSLHPHFLTQLQHSNITSTMAPSAASVPVRILQTDFAKCFPLMMPQNQNDDGSAAVPAVPTLQEVAENLLEFPESATPPWSLAAAKGYNFPAVVGTPAVCCATPGKGCLARAC
jgi:hypothetical protein